MRQMVVEICDNGEASSVYKTYTTGGQSGPPSQYHYELSKMLTVWFRYVRAIVLLSDILHVSFSRNKIFVSRAVNSYKATAKPTATRPAAKLAAAVGTAPADEGLVEAPPEDSVPEGDDEPVPVGAGVVPPLVPVRVVGAGSVMTEG